MNKKINIVLSIVLLVNASAFCQHNFSGTWVSSNSSSEFSLSISQSGNKISGYHCSIMNNGAKIDCSDDNAETFTGNVISDSIVVNFKSCFCNKSGVAKAKLLTPNSISWKIDTKPDGEFYIPENAKLFKSMIGSFTMNSGFTNLGCSASNYGVDVTVNLFFSSISIMTNGTDYYIATLSENLRPNSTKTFSTTVNSKQWIITISSNGKIYCKISSGSNHNPGTVVHIESLSFKLCDEL